MALGISIISLMIAGITAYFVFSQHALEKSKFKLEAYDRRIKVFDAIKSFIASIRLHSTTDEEQLFQLLRETKQAIFLFDDDDISDYIEELNDKGLDLQYKSKEVQGEFGSLEIDERKELSIELRELRNWFAAQLEKVDEKFKPYLKL